LATLSDKKLVISCNNGHKQHCQELFERYDKRIKKYFIFKVGNENVAEDLAQKTLLKAWTGLKGFKFKSTFKTWLYRIARYRFIDYLREQAKIRNNPSIPIGDVDSGVDIPETDNDNLTIDPQNKLLENEKKTLLHVAINKLSPDHKEVILLHLEGFSYSEIAEITEEKMGTVSSQIHYAKKKIEKILMPYILKE